MNTIFGYLAKHRFNLLDACAIGALNWNLGNGSYSTAYLWFGGLMVASVFVESRAERR